MYWLFLALGIAVVDWFALFRGARRLDYIAKPGVMLALLGGVGTTLPAPWHSGFTWGVLFSLAGDVFLMLPQERFIAGLAAFLLAHVAYIIGFTPHHLQWTWEIGILGILLGSIAFVLGKHIIRGVRQRGNPFLAGAVTLYMVIITLMFFSAWSTWWQPGWSPLSALMASIGSTLFLLSDALLAWNRFVRPLTRARLKVRIPYHLGQILLIGSALLPHMVQ